MLRNDKKGDLLNSVFRKYYSVPASKFWSGLPGFGAGEYRNIYKPHLRIITTKQLQTFRK